MVYGCIVPVLMYGYVCEKFIIDENGDRIDNSLIWENNLDIQIGTSRVIKMSACDVIYGIKCSLYSEEYYNGHDDSDISILEIDPLNGLSMKECSAVNKFGKKYLKNQIPHFYMCLFDLDGSINFEEL